MKLSLVRVLPLVVAFLIPSAALAEEGAKEAAGGAAHKPKVTQTAKRAAKAPKAKAAKAPKAAKKAAAPKASKKAPKASKKTAAK